MLWLAWISICADAITRWRSAESDRICTGRRGWGLGAGGWVQSPERNVGSGEVGRMKRGRNEGRIGTDQVYVCTSAGKGVNTSIGMSMSGSLSIFLLHHPPCFFTCLKIGDVQTTSVPQLVHRCHNLLPLLTSLVLQTSGSSKTFFSPARSRPHRVPRGG